VAQPHEDPRTPPSAAGGVSNVVVLASGPLRLSLKSPIRREGDWVVLVSAG
jgi:hypothetical protein